MSDVNDLGLAAYEDVANEYYDTFRHPTCASFRVLSCRYLLPRLGPICRGDGLLIEVGAGRSVLAPAARALGLKMSQVILIDSSSEMLRHSSEWADVGVQLIEADAATTGLPSHSADLVVASMGDPYNDLRFWREVVRVLKPSGVCLFTAPSFEWATEFRGPSQAGAAEFVRIDGRVLLMPSYVRDRAAQSRMFSAAGLMVVDVEGLSVQKLGFTPAPKLRCVSAETPVIYGFTVRPKLVSAG